MAIEQSWPAVPPRLFTVDGGQFGLVTVADASGFKVKQTIVIKSNTRPTIALQVKRVKSKTEILVGPNVAPLSGPKSQTDLTSYTVADGASIFAGEQPKVKLKPDDILQAIYRQEPGTTIGVELDDEFGTPIGAANPLPVTFDGTISIGQVQVEGENGNTIEPNDDGSLNVNIVSSPVSGHTVKNKYNELIAIPSGSQTEIVSYTVPFAKTAVLQRITTSGDNVARYDVYLNGVSLDTQRTMFGSDLNALFEWVTGTNEGFTLSAADVISVKVIHSRPMAGNFNARVQILEIT